jgi:hypothetical protein
VEINGALSASSTAEALTPATSRVDDIGVSGNAAAPGILTVTPLSCVGRSESASGRVDSSSAGVEEADDTGRAGLNSGTSVDKGPEPLAG